MTPALAAHLRLLHQIPRERVRTHEARPPIVAKGGHGSPASTLLLNERILALRGEGFAKSEIAERLRVSLVTVRNHLNGKIRAGKR